MPDSNRPIPSNSREGQFLKFDRMGVDQVRRQYGIRPAGLSSQVSAVYSFAAEWLAKFDEADRLSTAVDNAEAKQMARSAKNAAWAAAIAAIVAAIAAIASAVISFSGFPRS